MPSDDSSRIDSEVQNSSPLTYESTTLNPQANQSRRYPLRIRKKPDRFGFSNRSSNVVYPISDFVSYHRLYKAQVGFALQLSFVSISSHFHEALEDPKCKSAMVEEMKALRKNSTWEIVKLPMGKKTIVCKWIFSVKYKSDGTIDRYKNTHQSHLQPNQAKKNPAKNWFYLQCTYLTKTINYKGMSSSSY